MNIQKKVGPISRSFRIALATVSILVASAVAVLPGLADPTSTESADSITAQQSAQTIDTATPNPQLLQSPVYGGAASVTLLLKSKADFHKLVRGRDQSWDLGAEQWRVPPSD